MQIIDINISTDNVFIKIVFYLLLLLIIEDTKQFVYNNFNLSIFAI